MKISIKKKYIPRYFEITSYIFFQLYILTSGIFLIRGEESKADNFAINAFYSLILGLLIHTIRIFNDVRKKERGLDES